MNLKQHNGAQIELALGDVNRYYFHQHYGHDGSDDELVMYFIEFGAEIFRKEHPDHGYANENQTPQTAS